MKVYGFIIKQIFLRRLLPTISVIALLFVSSYIVFTTSRSVVSTHEGEAEVEFINKPGTFIANLDPSSDVNTDIVSDSTLLKVYSYLDSNFTYAFYTDGFTTDLPNDEGMDVNISYFNENYYRLNTFPISAGNDLSFVYDLRKSDSIPILVGVGLSDEYPIGASVTFYDPGLQKTVNAKVQGVLEKNTSHSNFYALNSKQYYNFSIMIPVNDAFLRQSYMDLKLNALMDVIVTNSNLNEVSKLGEVMKQNLDLKLNFFNHKQNMKYFHGYYISSLKVILVISSIFLLIVLILSVWSALVSMRLTIKDFTINFLVGLSYPRLRAIFYTYYGLICLLNTLLLFAITAYSRHGTWLRKDSTFATYGLFGLISMDWFALLTVFVFNAITILAIVETVMWRIRKVPISLGVLQ